MSAAKYKMLLFMFAIIDDFQINTEEQNGGYPQSEKDPMILVTGEEQHFGIDQREESGDEEYLVGKREFL